MNVWRMQEGRFLTSNIAYIGGAGDVFMLGRECACVGKDDPDELPRNRMQKIDYGELKKYAL